MQRNRSCYRSSLQSCWIWPIHLSSHRENAISELLREVVVDIFYRINFPQLPYNHLSPSLLSSSDISCSLSEISTNVSPSAIIQYGRTGSCSTTSVLNQWYFLSPQISSKESQYSIKRLREVVASFRWNRLYYIYLDASLRSSHCFCLASWHPSQQSIYPTISLHRHFSISVSFIWFNQLSSPLCLLGCAALISSLILSAVNHPMLPHRTRAEQSSSLGIP